MLKLVLKYSEDYRTGTKIWIDKKELVEQEEEYSSEEDYSDDESFAAEIYLQTSDRYRVYLICGEFHIQEYKSRILSTSNEKKAKKTLKYLYSEINGQQPFVTTGHTSAYKETGYYPEALPSKDLVPEEIMESIESGENDYCVGIVVRKGKVIDFLQIIPEF